MNNEKPYVRTNVDEHANYLERKTQYEVGIAVLNGMSDLLKHSIQNPKLGWYRTINIVTEDLKDDFIYDLNITVSRDELTRNTYAVIR